MLFLSLFYVFHNKLSANQTLFEAAIEVLKGGSSQVEPSIDVKRLVLSKEQKRIINNLENGKDDYQKMGLDRTASR